MIAVALTMIDNHASFVNPHWLCSVSILGINLCPQDTKAGFARALFKWADCERNS